MPRCKHKALDPRGSRQMDMQACPLGSLLAGIKEAWKMEITKFAKEYHDKMFPGYVSSFQETGTQAQVDIFGE